MLTPLDLRDPDGNALHVAETESRDGEPLLAVAPLLVVSLRMKRNLLFHDVRLDLGQARELQKYLNQWIEARSGGRGRRKKKVEVP